MYFFYRISPAGQYLKLIDLEYCLINTSFSQQEIIEWFKSFRFLEVVRTLKLNNIIQREKGLLLYESINYEYYIIQ